MLKRIGIALFVLLATLPAGAAGVFVPIIIPVNPAVPLASTADYQNIKTVAVISALGTRLNFRNNHFIGPKDHRMDIADWNLDEDIEKRLRQYLSSRYEFRDVPFDRAALAAIPNGPWDGLGSKFPAFLHKLPADAVDAYIVVRPDLETGAPGVEGLGLENGGPFGDMTPVVWANYEIDIVNARTGKVIANADSRLRLRDKAPVSFAGLLVANDKFKVGDDFTLDATQSRLLRETLSHLLNVSLIETLRALDMGVNLPPSGARVLAPIPADKDPNRNYKSLAIVSGIGETLDLEHMGGTVLSRDSYRVPISDWQLDTMMEKRAQDAVSGRFAIKTVPVDRAAFAKAQMWDGDGKAAPNFPGLAASPDIDLYVAFVKVASTVPPTAAAVSGIGVFNKSVVMSMTEAFADYAIVILDAHTMKVLMAARAVPSPARPDNFPLQSLDAAFWPSSPPALTEAQAAKIKDTITDLLTDSEDEMLLRSGLTGQMVTDETPSVPSASAAQ